MPVAVEEPGGDILFVEATKMAGDGKLILTGQLGDVMKESAQAALSLVKSRADHPRCSFTLLSLISRGAST